MSKLAALILIVSKSARHWVNASDCIGSGPILSSLAVTVLCLAGFFAGCTEVSIARAQHQIAAGDYAAAHDYLAAEATRFEELSPHQRRVVMDGLCLSEYRIGAPTYPLNRQLSTCNAALKQPGSKSGEIFSDISGREHDALSKTINTALAQHDIVSADEAILRYRAIPGGNPQTAAAWTHQLWTIVNHATTPERAALTPAISHLSRQFRHEQNMSDRQFRRWIEKNMTVDGSLMVSQVEVGKHTIDLWLGDGQLTNAALNLDRFARVNDGLVARCHCNGLTKVGLKDSGLPAYLVRLDAANHQSEVLVLDQP
jgi:hypothetical protein